MADGPQNLRRAAPAAALLLVALLGGLSVGTSWLIGQHFRDDAGALSRLYSGVFAGLNSPDEGGERNALLTLGEQVGQLGMPLVLTDSTGAVTGHRNLPSSLTKLALDDPRLTDYVARLDREYPPLRDSLNGQLVHYGTLPAQRQLAWLAVVQALTLLVMVAVAVFAYRSGMGAQRDRLWVAMAREAAHQMGTPLMSLQGWIETLRSSPVPSDDMASHLNADAERLDRVAKRFERIGNPARRDPVALGALAGRVADYFRPRLPRRANSIELRVEAPGAGPTVPGDAVLLEWALEALVKNAIDALHGRAGTIHLSVGVGDDGAAEIRVKDDGPGVPREMRRTLFEPGITTKTGGWGIGLALARRVVQDAHGGDLLLESVDKGTSFLIRLPRDTATA